MLAKMWRNGTLLHCRWEHKKGQHLWKIVWWFLKKLNLPCDPAIPLLGIPPGETKTYVYAKMCESVFTAALFVIAPNWKQPKCPSTD